MYSEKFLKTLKLLTSLFLVMLQTFFIKTALKGELDTPRTLEGHLGTRALKALGHLGTWALRYLGTWALEEHLGTQDSRDTLFSRIFFSYCWLSTANLCFSLLVAKSTLPLFKIHLLLIIMRNRLIHFSSFGPCRMTHVKKENKTNCFFNNMALSENSFSF